MCAWVHGRGCVSLCEYIPLKRTEGVYCEKGGRSHESGANEDMAVHSNFAVKAHDATKTLSMEFSLARVYVSQFCSHLRFNGL